MRFKNITYVNFVMLVFYNFSIFCDEASIDLGVQRGVTAFSSKIVSGEIKKELNCVNRELDTVFCKEKTIITKIDQCCATLNSKLDLALEGFSIVSICDLSPIISKVDDCCAQLNSGVDTLDTHVCDCCVVLTNTITSVSSAINNLVVSCCDGILALEASIVSQVSTLNSQIDSLDVDIQSCCSTVNSKVDSLFQGVS